MQFLLDGFDGKWDNVCYLHLHRAFNEGSNVSQLSVVYHGVISFCIYLKVSYSCWPTDKQVDNSIHYFPHSKWRLRSPLVMFVLFA